MSAPSDTAFRDAVRLAATGLRTGSGMDPEIEAAPLAAILRSDRPLDVDGLELLARLAICDLHKVKSPAGESEFATAVRRAGTAWRKGKDDVDPVATGAALVELLQAEAERILHREAPQLGQGERALLADWVTGELRRGQSRPSKGAGLARIEMIVKIYRFVREISATDTDAIKRISKIRSNRGGTWSDRYVNHTDPKTGEKFTVSERTVKNYISMIKKREAAIQQAYREGLEREREREAMIKRDNGQSIR